MTEGFFVVYAKKCNKPNNIHFKDRINIVEFLLYNANDIDFLSINDVIIDLNKLINNNLMLSRYLKLTKNYEI
jgi:hypothetical protein